VEFMEMIPNEVRLVVRKLSKSNAESIHGGKEPES
jgi:hypothetical protein